MIKIEKIVLCVGNTIKGCMICGEIAHWYVSGIDIVYFCHPHLCILSGSIERAVEESEEE